MAAKEEKIHSMSSHHEDSDRTSGNKKLHTLDSCPDSGFCRSGSNIDSSLDESVSDNSYRILRLEKQETEDSSGRAMAGWYPEETAGLETARLETAGLETPGLETASLETGTPMTEEAPSEKRVDGKTCGDGEANSPTNSPKNIYEMKSVGDSEENESDRAGCEGGSEGSSPVPSEEQQSPIPLDTKASDPHLMEFLPGDGEPETEVQPEPNPKSRESDGEVQLEPEVEAEERKEAVTLSEPILITKENKEPFPMRNTVSPMEEEEKPVGQPVKWPPNVEESGSSGDSSEKKPPPQLPKLHKNKPLAGQKRSRHTMSQKLLSDTQENNESSNSTGSECDEGPHAKRPHHQKPHKMLSKPRPAKMLQKALQERNVKRTKLIKRKESNSIKAKALLHHHPTPEDISNLLKEFTVDFMMNGYSNLLQGLRLQVMLPYQIDLDKSHLLWLITYFLRFAVELDLELSQICPVLCVDVSLWSSSFVSLHLISLSVLLLLCNMSNSYLNSVFHAYFPHF